MKAERSGKLAGTRLALREVRRGRARFGLLTGAVGLLAFLILFQQTVLTSLITQFVGAIRNQSAPVLVYGADARRNVEGSRVTEDTIAKIRDVPGVARAEHIGEGTFTVTTRGALHDAVLFGYEIGGLGAPTTLTSGRLPTRDGEAVASDLDRNDGFDIGDRIRVEPNGPKITVVGLARDLRFSVAPTLFLSYDTYSRARLAANPDATAVMPSLAAVTPEAGVSPAEVARRITQSIDGTEALDRGRAARESPGVSAVQQSLGIVLLLAYIVVTLVTGFFFMILTVQKAESLTLLRAVGAPGGYLVRALLAQVVAVVSGGVIVGVVLLAATARAMQGGVAITVEPRSVLATAVVVLGLSMLASITAARRVLRIEPVRATTGAGVEYS